MNGPDANRLQHAYNPPRRPRKLECPGCGETVTVGQTCPHIYATGENDR